MIDWVHHESYTSGTFSDRTVCSRCRENGECAWQNHEETICRGHPAWPLTNGDRIRRMSDEELAIFMFCILTVDGSVADAPIFGNHVEAWREWFGKESKL